MVTLASFPREARPVIAAFGARVRARRRAAHMTQDQLAERARIKVLFVNRIENSRANPSLATMVLVAAALGCHVSELLAPPDLVVPATY